jgi:hypothetical protein
MKNEKWKMTNGKSSIYHFSIVIESQRRNALPNDGATAPRFFSISCRLQAASPQGI